MRSNIVLVGALFLSVLASAQSGSAPPGYYPADYDGSIFKGFVIESSANNLALSPVKGKKGETFEGSFVSGCSVPTTNGHTGTMRPADIPKGTEMTVLFKTRTRKADGNSIKENLIVGISFDTWQGQKVPDSEKRIFWCVDSSYLQFKAFR